MCAALWLWGSWGVAEARLRPYYVLSHDSFGQIRPRVLLMFDNSNSMSFKARSAVFARCAWNECDVEGSPSESRLSEARRGVQRFVEASSGAVDFSLMTFEFHGAPATQAPPFCHKANGDLVRFAWVERYNLTQARPLGDPIAHYPSTVGTWALCGGHEDAADPTSPVMPRPYAYLRWDDLGAGASVPSGTIGTDPSAPLPKSPMIATDALNVKSDTNARRKVQWFPDFLGVRVHLDDTSDPDGTILARSVGDYGSTPATRAANVKGHDFYYWPYVDGFVGYSSPALSAPGAYTETMFRTGIARGTRMFRGSLFAPFFLRDRSLSAVAAVDQGPESRGQVATRLIDAMQPLTLGGLTAASGVITPLAEAIGSTGAPLLQDNSEFSHPSVASYLRFVHDVDTDRSCRPTHVVVITDADPGLAQSSTFERLAGLRRQLGVQVHMIGVYNAYNATELNALACAAAGACDGLSACDTPCDDAPADNWDTCADPGDPANGCAHIAESPEQLEAALQDALARTLDSDRAVSSGPGTSLASDLRDAAGDPTKLRTSIEASTVWPGWEGHVRRTVCDDEIPDGLGGAELAPWCQPPSPTPTIATIEGESEYTFGPCAPSWEWDAGECLAQRSWRYRRVYTHGADNKIMLVYDPNGDAGDGIPGVPTARFAALMAASGLLAGSNEDADIVAFARFLQGRAFPDGWSLPGLANAAPVVIRRVPKPQPGVRPTVPLADPHCAGRALDETRDVPPSLRTFAAERWDASNLIGGPQVHREDQEVVLIGDDLGVLHAFQLASGNELWGFLPRALLASAVAQFREGAQTRGQPEAVAEHHFGIAATPVHGWVYDRDATRWRHVVVLGLGEGGREMVALDVAHASPWSRRVGRPSCDDLSTGGCPLEVLWTSEDAALATDHDAIHASTWSRPAMIYHVPNDAPDVEPYAELVVGGGLPETPDPIRRGRSLARVDATRGTVIESAAVTPPYVYRYDTRKEGYGLAGDVAVTSHCRSRLWPEAQSMYVGDPAGRLFRWDLSHAHRGGDNHDSGQDWHASVGPLQGAPDRLTWLWACRGDVSCTPTRPALDPTTKGEPLWFPPAVTTLDRIDGTVGSSGPHAPAQPHAALLAIAGGAPNDDATDGADADNDYHSSLFVLLDDPQPGAEHGGLAVPLDQPKTVPGDEVLHRAFARLALSDLTRTRRFAPFPGSPSYEDVGRFSKRTRPVRAPRILVKPVVDGSGNLIADAEAYEIEFYVHEAPDGNCDGRFFDAANDRWVPDLGASYVVRLRLVGDDGQIDLRTGAARPAQAGDDASQGLSLVGVEQLTGGDCADGNCAPRSGTPGAQPCDRSSGFERNVVPHAVVLNEQRSEGFTPVER